MLEEEARRWSMAHALTLVSHVPLFRPLDMVAGVVRG